MLYIFVRKHIVSLMCMTIGHEFTYELRSIRDISTQNEYIHRYVSYASRQKFPHFRLYLRKRLWRHSFYTHQFSSFYTTIRFCSSFNWTKCDKPLCNKIIMLSFIIYFKTRYSFSYSHEYICNFPIRFSAIV